MKKKKGYKLFGVLAALVLAVGFASADWIEPYDSNTRNDLYMEDATIHGNITLYGSLNTSSGVANVQQMWENPAAVSSYVVYSVAVTTAQVGVTYSTGHIVATGLTLTPWARTYGFSFNTGYSTQTATGTAYIVGRNALGDSVTETVNIKNCDVEYSSYAYTSITSVLWKLTATDAEVAAGNGEQGQGTAIISLNIGTGYKMGLVGDISKASDVYFVNEAGTVTTTYTADATYDTIDFATDPNGSNEYYVIFNQKAQTK